MGDELEKFNTIMSEISGLYILKESDKAYQVTKKDRRGNVTTCWIPKSQIDYIRKYPANAEGHRECLIHIPDWLAEKNNLE